MSARERSLPSGGVRFALEAGFIVLVGVVAAVLDLRPLAIVIVMGIAWVVVTLFERVAKSPRPARAARPHEEPARPAGVEGPPLEEESDPEPEPRRRSRFAESSPESDPAAEALSTGEWNLWELERRARDHVGKDSVPEEWAAMFVNLREYASSDGRLPPQFDELVRETFPELTRVG